MKVHFIGIGGIGISAIARMFLGEGKVVSGSDQSLSLVTEELVKLGAKIELGHAAENVPQDVDLVIYTIALAPDNPELLRARLLTIPVVSYPEMLGQISADKYTIAVSGTHGKTTTTAMIAQIFLAAGLDPTVIVGSLMNDSKSNFISGQSKYFIVEACEYRRSFLNLSPKVLVITNIDNDHLDYYKDLAGIQSAFVALAAKLPADGFLICNATDPLLGPVIAATAASVVDYKRLTTAFKLKAPGQHNVMNAQAALAVAQSQGISPIIALEALDEFRGTWRRFEYLGQTKSGALVYDDYGHHPTEIQATLAGARELFPDHKIIVVFQPHLYSRTKLLLKEFALSFNHADQVLVAPIYAAREPIDPQINSEILARAITAAGTPAEASADVKTLKERLLKLELAKPMVIITMGAGDIFQLAQELV